MSLSRLLILTRKEFVQLVRDPLSVVTGILLPIMLLLICGFGMSTDVRNIRLAIVVPESSQSASAIAARFQSNGFFDAVIVRSTEEGKELIRTHQADACLFLPRNLSRRVTQADVQILVAVNASNPSPGYLKQSYIQSSLLNALNKISESGDQQAISREHASRGIEIQTRQWFNDANRSVYTIIPGIIVVILTIIGCLLTSIVMAREYEQGNMESLFVTPMKSTEIILAKMIINFCLGIIGLFIALAMARYVFGVPMRGNVFILLFGSSLYLIMSLAIGILISSAAKNQFIAISLASFISFLPSYLLSGFLFEIKSMPTFLQYITLIVPARYYVDFLQTSLLVGDVWPNILKNCGVLILMTVVLLFLARLSCPKRL